MVATTVSFINFKGGVGKSTLTAELAARLVFAHNKKVLLIDADPQTNASVYFMDQGSWKTWTDKNGSVLNLFKAYINGGLSSGKFDLTRAIMKDFYVNPETGRHSLRNLSLLPAHLEMMGLEADLAYEIGRRAGDISQSEKVRALKRYQETLGIFKDVLKGIKEEYDFIFFDCPPSVGLITQSALAASDSYFVPSIPDYLSTIGLNFLNDRVDEMVRRMNEANKAVEDGKTFNGPKRKGVIFSRVRVYRWGPPLEYVSPQDLVIERLKNDKLLGPLLFQNFLSESARVQESAEDHIPVGIRSGAKYAQSREQVEQIALEFLKRV